MAQHWSYDMLKHIAVNDKLANDHLEDFKSLFSTDIGSARNASRIKTIDDLMDCLERHDALTENNIEPLREIADHFGGEALEEAVSHYVGPKDATSYNEPYNQYRELRLAEELRTNLRLNGPNHNDSSDAAENEVCNCSYHRVDQQQRPVPPQPPAPVPTPYAQVLTDNKRAAIFKVISENIGKFWRALGRELEIRQGKMDELEMQYSRDLVSRVYEMLHVFEKDESQDPKRLVLTLCRALEECRRMDLRRKVEEIMMH